MTYNIPKPTLPAWTVASVVIIFGGVIALGVIAFITFRLFNLPIIPAGLLAGVIEYSTFTAGVNLIRGNRLTWPEIIIGLIGSGVVNYVHFQAANNAAVTKVTSPVLLGILAVFPLLVIFSSSLWIGKEIKEHGEKVKTWEAGRDQWLKDQEAAAAAMRIEVQEEERAAQADAREKERADRAEIRRLEIAAQERVQLAQIEAQKAEHAAQLAAQERADRAEARRLARADRAAAQAAVQPAQPPAQPEVQSVQPAQKGTYEDFKIAQLARNGAGPMDYRQIIQRFNVSRRTAYDWLAKYAQEQPQHITQEMN